MRKPIKPLTTRILRTERRVIDGQEVEVKICPPGGIIGTDLVRVDAHPTAPPWSGGRSEKEELTMFTCPKCHSPISDYFNAGKAHFGLCHACRIHFFAGSNLFSSWRDQTEEEQRRIHHEWTVERKYRQWTDPSTVEEARIVLSTCVRSELRDHAFGDMEVTWTDRQGNVVADGYFGSGGASVYFDGSSFEGNDARALRDSGVVGEISRNDSTGPEDFREGEIMPGLTLAGVLKELEG